MGALFWRLVIVYAPTYRGGIMHFLIRETLSFNLMYVTSCYPVGTTISKTSSLFTALLQHYNQLLPRLRSQLWLNLVRILCQCQTVDALLEFVTLLISRQRHISYKSKPNSLLYHMIITYSLKVCRTKQFTTNSQTKCHQVITYDCYKYL